MNVTTYIVFFLFGILPLVTTTAVRKANTEGIDCSIKRFFMVGRREGNRGIASLFLISFGLIFFLFYRIPYIGLVILYDLPFIFLGRVQFYKDKRKKKRWSYVVVMCLTLLLIVVSIISLGQEAANARAQSRVWFSFLVLLFWLFNLEILTILFSSYETKEDKVVFYGDKFLSALNVTMILGIIVVLIFVQTFSRMGYHVELGSVELLWIFFSNPVQIINLYFLIALFVLFYCMGGRGIGTLFSMIVILFLFISNFLKLKYHDTFFSWFDLLQVKEMLLMGEEFVNKKEVLLIMVVVIAVIVILVAKRKKISSFWRPVICPLNTIFSLMLLVGLTGLLMRGSFKELDIYARTWENENINVQYNGLVLNQVLNLNNLKEAIMERPDSYTADTVRSFKDEFKRDYLSMDSEIKPDVILILAESYFDLENVEGLELSIDIDETIEQYTAAKLLSPRFGGYTSAIEFEALTGLSLAFLPNSLTPYTTYFNNPDAKFPSIVQEFTNNNYITKVIHPNLPDFYNRTIVYNSLGFQEYLSIEDFVVTKDNTTENGWIKDEQLGKRIIEELDMESEPQFIFAMTMEEHYVTLEKYSETEVKLQAPTLIEKDRAELEQQAQSYYNTDKMVRKLIEYMNNTDKPTLLYLFGDHLPPINALGELGYTKDKYQKYATSFVMYSNYKSISVEPKYITPNQIAAQIMHDSKIPHSGYFDYIFNLRNSYPVVHKEFIDVDNTSNLDLYKFIQYDLLFGNRWLVEEAADE